MRVIIDTHIFIYMLGSPEKLSANQRAIVEDPSNELLLSLASVWEIIIKHSLGKLQLPTSPGDLFPAQLNDLAITLLPMSLAHILEVGHLPYHHQDPFDRLIIAQANVEKCSIVSSDRHFHKYITSVLD